MEAIKPAKTKTCYHNSLFFSDNSLSKLKNVMLEKVVSKGTWLFLEGDSADKLYFLKNGIMKLTKTADDGKELALYYYQPGDFLGEFEGMDVTTCSFGAKAVHDSTVGVVHLQDLKKLVQNNGELALDFVKWTTHLQRFTQYKLRDLLFYGKEGALASTLIRMANSYGKENDGHIQFSVEFTNSELAQMIGATRETVNRMLRQLKKKNVIDYQHGSIVIKDLQHLKEICHCENCPVEVCHL